MKKTLVCLAIVTAILCAAPGLAQDQPAKLSPVKAKAMADALLRICEDTAQLRIQLLAKRLEFERLSAKPGVNPERLNRLQAGIMALDNELAGRMTVFLLQTRRMIGQAGQQQGASKMSRGGRSRGGMGMMTD